ncbi:MAG: hypothetical protein K5897_02100 [Eubacterium sp.]|nr:hypothetical protein [Eubacterium sp.]
MFRVMNEYLAKVHLEIDERFSQKMDLFLSDRKEIVKYCININYNKYVVDVHLKKYSIEAADKLFCDLAAQIAYPYSHMSLRYNEGDQVRYRFVTCNEEKSAVYMDLVLEK